ncbi:hypothetical protein [Vulcanococcus limneticus]|uniref:hypothetical protein n=1 Tax=Vulcanococcus limneticus TaxID=2170428 RepID=UPI00398BCB54
MTSEPPTPCHDPAAAEVPSGGSRSATGRSAGDEELRVLLALAESLEGDPAALLDLLRRLEKLHRTIQDGAFRNSLPEDRNRLFQLLESMEDSGGWPYIPRLQLRTFLDLLQREAPREARAEGEQPLAA